MTSLGCGCGNSGAAIAEAVGWTTVFEEDFTALDPQTITGNGPVVINGTTYTVAGFAGSSLFEIQPGVGLVVRCLGGATRDYNGASGDLAPRLLLPVDTLADIATQYDRPIEVGAHWGAVTFPNNFNACAAGLGGDVGTGYSSMANGAGRMRSAGVTVPYLQTGNTQGAAVNALSALDVTYFRNAQDSFVWMYAGTWADGQWPSSPLLGARAGGSNGSATNTGTLLLRRPGAVVYCAVTTEVGTAGDVTATLQRLRVRLGPRQAPDA